jgi:NAD(P)-dependent dehydrogenase (short-subunit alcohol dehydrogenase family)
MRVIITGGSSGIGLSLAKVIAARNPDARMILVGRDASRLEAAAAGLPGATPVTADLSDPDAAASIVETATAEMGGIDSVVSNAGALYSGALADISPADFLRGFQINVHATFHLAQAAYPELKKSRGVLVATGSMAGRNPTPGLGSYSASKAALAMLIAQLAIEWGPDGIRCNCVSPGTVMTPLNAPAYADPGKRAERTERIPLGRLGEPDDIANVIHFLLQPEAGFVTGVDLTVDGGAGRMLMPLYLRSGPDLTG